MSTKRPPPAPPKAPAFRNETLRAGLGKWKAEAKAEPTPVKPAPAKATPAARPKPSKHVRAADDEDALFRRVMEDVAPIPSKAPKAADVPEPSLHADRIDEDAEALASLAELVSTGDGLVLTGTDEYVEGLAAGVDGGLLVALRRGDFGLQGQVDLHGLGPDAAKDRLDTFMVESRRRGLRCVLIVHDHELKAKDEVPVIKQRLGAWLSRGRLARILLAFATARPVDGGSRALYVLLRR